MRKKPVLTSWFPVEIKPARVGEYEAQYPEEPGKVRRRYWNGSAWSIARGVEGGTLFGWDSGDKWRGLAEKPE